jgi:hypothetical protein
VDVTERTTRRWCSFLALNFPMPQTENHAVEEDLRF